MSDSFDPYQKSLGIAPKDQPPRRDIKLPSVNSAEVVRNVNTAPCEADQ